MKKKVINIGFGVYVKPIKKKSTISDVEFNDYEIGNVYKKKMKGGKK